MTRKTSFPLPLDTPPMEAKLVACLPEDEGWQFEPKWDGFRCLAFRRGGEIDLRARSGKSLSRYFPEIVKLLAGILVEEFVVDGELLIVLDGTLSFDALQQRLHPAESRIRKLARETPAMLMLFDCLADGDGSDLRGEPLHQRRTALEHFYGAGRANPALRLSPRTHDRPEAEKWLARAGGALDGVVAKRLDGPYRSGERAMLKIKPMRTADCVVGGFRYRTDRKEVGSLLLGLYNEVGELDHVGFTSSIAAAERQSLTHRLEKLAETPGFTGKAPGGPSRWSTERSGEWTPLAPKLVVEVRYDHVTGDRFRHGTKFLRWRPDKAPRQCRLEQLEPEASPAELVSLMRAPVR